MLFLIDAGVVLLIVSTRILAARRADIWLFIRANNGDMTIVMPKSTTAGSWKQRLFPNPVAAWRKTSCPCRAAVTTSRWTGLGTFQQETRSSPQLTDLNASRANTFRRVKSISIFDFLPVAPGMVGAGLIFNPLPIHTSWLRGTQGWPNISLLESS